MTTNTPKHTATPSYTHTPNTIQVHSGSTEIDKLIATKHSYPSLQLEQSKKVKEHSCILDQLVLRKHSK